MDYEEKLKVAWKLYGEQAGEYIERYHIRFLKIVKKYAGKCDVDELYSSYVHLKLPVYIYNWNPAINKDVLSWICYCIYLNVWKHRIKRMNNEISVTNEWLDNYQNDLRSTYENQNNVCSVSSKIGIESIEELLLQLSRYDAYLVQTIVIDDYPVSKVASINNRSQGKIRSDLSKALSRCRQILK